ncbi:MAG: archaetidylserine decarboxylase [Myxococcota bacterium]
MNREWVVDVVARLPQGLVSRAWGWVARRRHPRAGVEALKRTFVAATGIDMREAAEPIGSYQTLEELFTRTLKSGSRRVDPEPHAVVCPVDGAVGACGVVREGIALQVKGRSYPVAKLLGSAAEASRYEGGYYATFYLSPKDYHRIHSPLAGTVSHARVIPGSLMPVFHESLSRVDELFARNERLITYVDHEQAGRVAVVKVGATLVGRICVIYAASLRSNDPKVERLEREYSPPIRVYKGGELGAFELGSTVVLFFEKDAIRPSPIEAGESVRLGERIGTLRAAKSEKASPAEESAKKAPPKKSSASAESTSKKSSSKKVAKKKTAKTKAATKKTGQAKATKKTTTKKKTTKKKASSSGNRAKKKT